MARRPWDRIVLAFLFALSTFACGPTATSDPGPQEGWVRVEDAPERFTIDVPAHWRSLEPGDPGWRVVYGDRVTRSERLVEDGTMPIFAVPLAPRDEDPTVVLAVYVTHLTGSTTLAELADTYIESALSLDGEVRLVERRSCQVSAGECVEIIGDRATGDQVPVRLHFWYFLAGDRSFLINFNSQVPNAEHYDPIFVHAVDTFRILPAEEP